MKKWIKIVIVLAVAGIIGLFLIYTFVYNKPHPDFETERAVFTVDAAALYHEFSGNADAAGQKYNGKIIEVTGAITSVESTDSLVTLVFVFNEGMFGGEGVRCAMLPSHAPAAGKLAAGTPVNIKGLCTGFTGDVILEKCSIINQK
jgi:hypothetical protein